MTLIYVVAGEASGDVLGARLMSALRVLSPEVEFAGVGGVRMAEQGLQSLFPLADLAVMGIVEVIPRIRLLRRRLAEVQADLARLRPAVVVTIDSPGFMHRVLAGAARLGLRRVHYVAPQVWAWRAHRVRHYPGLWDKLLCLLPFEPAWFARHGLDGVFVGHPVLESGAGRGDGDRFRAAHGIAADAPVLVMMPGSRRSEVPRLLPVFGATLALLAREMPGLVPVLPVSAVVEETVRRAVRGWPVAPVIVTGLDEKHDAYSAAGVALTKSGTSTLELALAGVPMAVTYRVNALSAALARRMIRVPYVAMVNLLAGRALVPELLQGDCNPRALADVVLGLLRQADVAAAQRAGFRGVIDQLRPEAGTASSAAAREVLDLVAQNGPAPGRLAPGTLAPDGLAVVGAVGLEPTTR